MTASTTFTIAPDGAVQRHRPASRRPQERTRSRGPDAGKTGSASLTVAAGRARPPPRRPSPIGPTSLAHDLCRDDGRSAHRHRDLGRQDRDRDADRERRTARPPGASRRLTARSPARRRSYTAAGPRPVRQLARRRHREHELHDRPRRLLRRQRLHGHQGRLAHHQRHESGKTGTDVADGHPGGAQPVWCCRRHPPRSMRAAPSRTRPKGFDQYSNSLGDVTASTTFTIAPDGSCSRRLHRPRSRAPIPSPATTPA